MEGDCNDQNDNLNTKGDMITVRNYEYPFKNFNEESRINALAAKESILMY